MTTATDANTEFNYLLNAVELAAGMAQPAAHGYGEKRAALIAHVRKLEALAARAAAPAGEPADFDALLLYLNRERDLYAASAGEPAPDDCDPTGVERTARKEAEADVRDAQRYRWLRLDAYEAVIPHGGKLAGKRTAWITHLLPGPTFDDAVDAALAAPAGEPSVKCGRDQ